MAPFDLARADTETVSALRRYGASWRAAALAAVPADRTPAEAAVTELYERASLARPRFGWVASPAAVRVAAELIGYGPKVWPMGPRHLRAKIDPRHLRPDPRWAADTRRWMGDDPADDPRRPLPYRPVADLLGLDALRSSLGIVKGSGTLASLADATPMPAVASGAVAVGPVEWASVTAALPGSLVEKLLRRIGREVIEGARTVAGPESGWLGNVPPWTMGQFDPLGPYLAVAHELLGRRITAERRDAMAPFLALAQSSGPWVALDGLAILSERATSRQDAAMGHFLLTYADGLGIVGVSREVE